MHDVPDNLPPDQVAESASAHNHPSFRSVGFAQAVICHNTATRHYIVRVSDIYYAGAVVAVLTATATSDRGASRR